MRKSGNRGHRPLTKTQLLPMPVHHARRLSLKHHLALACLADGRGDVETLSTVSNVVELAHQLDTTGVEIFQIAEEALGACIARAARTSAITLTEAERNAIAIVLVHHDAQLERVPIHRYLDALEQTAAYARQLAVGKQA